MAKARTSTEEAKRAARLAAHWRTRAAEFRRLAHGPERSMFKRAAEAEAIARSFERARANGFCSDFAITVDGRPVYGEIDGEPVEPRSFPRR